MKRIIRLITRLLIFFFVSSVLSVVILRWMPVYFTPLMGIRCVQQIASGNMPKLEHHWVPIDSISHNLAQAVVASEDNRFPDHNGFDFKEIYKARLEAFEGGKVRGASTISQQTAKNVFLWPGHSWVRKGFEAYFTVLIEWVWGKERIIEVYLNSIEMGDGIYGAWAIAHHSFGCEPWELDRNQAALVATTLPDPLHRDSANPTGKLIKRRERVVSNMRALPSVPWGYRKQ